MPIFFKCKFLQMWACSFFLLLSIFSFLPHVFLVTDNQSSSSPHFLGDRLPIDSQLSFSTNRHEHWKLGNFWRLLVIILLEAFWKHQNLLTHNWQICWIFVVGELPCLASQDFTFWICAILTRPIRAECPSPLKFCQMVVRQLDRFS